MADYSLASGVAAASSVVDDELVACNHHLLMGRPKQILATGQNLKRGALLGRITASGKYVLSLAAAGDGSQTPAAVLVHDMDATAADKEVDIYERGDFNGDRLTLGAGHTLASVRDVLHDKGITLHKRYGAAA